MKRYKSVSVYLFYVFSQFNNIPHVPIVLFIEIPRFLFDMVMIQNSYFNFYNW